MNYVLKTFEIVTEWNRDNSYENITSTSENLLRFNIPTSLKFQISNKSTRYTFNTFELSNNKVINGSLSYLYTNCKEVGDFVTNSTNVSLLEFIPSYRYIYPYYSNTSLKSNFKPSSLYYGRIYYPGSTLEAMYLKRLTPYTQLVFEFLSSMNNLNALTFYWKRDTGKNSQELIFSSNELLFGYRTLYNFCRIQSKLNKPSLYNPTLSLGGELWFGISNLSPGCSTTLRYCAHSSNTGKPLTFTLSLNPLYGHISSSYSIKTSPNTTLCSKYDFNIYSIESNLSFGCEIWRTKNIPDVPQTMSHEKYERLENQNFQLPKLNDWYPMDESDKDIYSTNPLCYHFRTPLELSKLGDHENISSNLIKEEKDKAAIQKLEDIVNASNFNSAIKMSTSLKDQNLRVLWMAKYRGFLISAGTELTTMPTKIPSNLKTTETKKWLQPVSFGIQIQYST